MKKLFIFLTFFICINILNCGGCSRDHDGKEESDETAGEEMSFAEYKVSLAFPAEVQDIGYYNISIKIGDKGPFTREAHSLTDAVGPHVLKDIKTKNLATIDVKVFNEKVIKIFSGTGIVTKDVPEATISLTAVSPEEHTVVGEDPLPKPHRDHGPGGARGELDGEHVGVADLKLDFTELGDPALGEQLPHEDALLDAPGAAAEVIHVLQKSLPGERDALPGTGRWQRAA